jgi:hypothetical protein
METYHIEFDKRGNISRVTKTTPVKDDEYTFNKTTGIIIDANITAKNEDDARIKAVLLSKRIYFEHVAEVIKEKKAKP